MSRGPPGVPGSRRWRFSGPGLEHAPTHTPATETAAMKLRARTGSSYLTGVRLNLERTKLDGHSA